MQANGKKPENKKIDRPRMRSVDFGAPGGIRTHGLQSRSLTRYPAALRAPISTPCLALQTSVSDIIAQPLLFAKGYFDKIFPLFFSAGGGAGFLWKTVHPAAFWTGFFFENP